MPPRDRLAIEITPAMIEAAEELGYWGEVPSSERARMFASILTLMMAADTPPITVTVGSEAMAEYSLPPQIPL
jgi:hypothetical protein